MHYFKFFLMVLVHILCQILYLPIHLLCRFAKPLSGRPLGLANTSIQGQVPSFAVEPYLYTGDGPKFLGMAYAATLREDIWEALLSLAYGGTLNRTPSLREDLPVFSGDQMAGFALALARRYVTGRLTPQDKAALRPVFDKIFFSGIPMTMPSATLGRGWLWCPWEPCGGATYSAYALSALCYHVFEDKRYLGYAATLSILTKISDWSPDFNFSCGKVYMQTWYAAHSLAISHLTLSILDLASPKVAEQLAARYPWNPDITVTPRNLLSHLTASPKDIEILDAYYKEDFFSLRSFTLKPMYIVEIPLCQRHGADYAWEANPHVISDGAPKPLETIFPLFLLTIESQSDWRDPSKVVGNNTTFYLSTHGLSLQDNTQTR